MVIKVVTLKVVVDKTLRFDFPVDKVSFPGDAGEVFAQYIGDKDREHLVVLCLSVANKINCLHTISIGTLGEAPAHPREVFKVAIETNSAKVILGHNHPSETLFPSNPDIQMTKNMIEAGKLMGIEVLDHIIVSGNEYISMKEKGYF